MKYTLRPYQNQAVSKLIWAQQFSEPDLAILPCGAGKSLIISELAYRLRQPILILQPSIEILSQNLEKMKTYVDDSKIGVYSAGMNKKDIGFLTFGTIQSCYKNPKLFSHFKQIIIDEADLVPIGDKNSMYMKFFKNIGSPKITGFTASPYRQAKRYERLPSGSILTHTTTKMINRVRNRFWFRIVYNLTTKELIDKKYLVPFRYFDKSIIEHEEIPTNISRSDFDLEAYEEKISDKETEILEAVFFGMELAKHVLVFCPSILFAERFSQIVPNSKVVSFKTKKKDRRKIIEEFRSGKIKTVFNVQILTMGFDFPQLDCIINLRPCRSIRLLGQMLGRGSRPAPSKKFCWIIDMTSTIKNLGRFETIRVEKLKTGWDIVSEKGQFHNKILFSFKIN